MPIHNADILFSTESQFKVDFLGGVFSREELNRTGKEELSFDRDEAFSVDSLLKRLASRSYIYDLDKMDKWSRRVGGAINGKTLSTPSGSTSFHIIVLSGPDKKVMLLLSVLRYLASKNGGPQGGQIWKEGQFAQSMISGKNAEQAKKQWLKVSKPLPPAWKVGLKGAALTNVQP